MKVDINKGLATIAVCALGAVAMHYTNGEAGVGWAVLGIFLIWFFG